MKKIKWAALTVVIALALTSCASTGIDMSTDLPNEPKEALLTGMSISESTTPSGVRGTIMAITDIVDGGPKLEYLGAEAVNSLSLFLESKGFVLFTNPEIAKREVLSTWGNVLGVGYWNHKDTSNYTTSYFTGFTLGFNKKKFISKVKQDDDVNYFIFSDIHIDEKSTFGGWGSYPTLKFTIVVVDQNGKVVLQASATGVGNKSLTQIDVSAENLALALNDAMTKLNEL